MLDLEKYRRELNNIFSENSVSIAYIFGSAAKDAIGPDSDIDVAVLFSENAPKEEFFERELNISHQMSLLLKKETDVVNLATVNSPVLKHNAVFEGKIIFVKDQEIQFELERKTRQEFEDTKYLREINSKIMRRQLQEGTFGKAPLSPQAEKIMARHAHK